LIYKFENFSLDRNRRELRRGSELISIEPQVFEFLEFLITNCERVVSNDDLIKAVWGVGSFRRNMFSRCTQLMQSDPVGSGFVDSLARPSD
jgi:DNA-binding winged helix-turn-helix (wHTH) protein